MLFWLSDNLSTSNHPNGNGRANPLPCTLDFHSNPLFAPPWVHMSLWDQGWLCRERRPTLFWQLKLPGKTFPALFLTDHPELQNNSAPPPPGAFPDRQHPPHTHTHKASSCAPFWCSLSNSNRSRPLLTDPWLWDPRPGPVWMLLPLHLACHLERRRGL